MKGTQKSRMAQRHYDYRGIILDFCGNVRRMDVLKPSDKFADVACQFCDGSGRTMRPRPKSVGWHDMIPGPCPRCNGLGVQAGKPPQAKPPSQK